MKQLSGSAAADVGASAEDCMALLAAVNRYPDWHPDVVRRVDVLERDAAGQATKAYATLHVAYGPLVRDFELTLRIDVEQPNAVTLERIPHEPTDPERFEVAWRVREAARRHIDLRLSAELPVPRMLPVGGVGDGLARGFVAAAVRALEGSR